jgi:crotonobetainyl-CoA:carnitine CoA-transferase CaiB-like acyl-CoA transferase
MPPLHGITVIDLTVARAGPTAVRQLADWGADVIRVEPLDTDSGSLSGTHSSYDYMNLHRNKRVIALDLKQSAGYDVFRRLVENADVLIENFRPPTKYALHIDYETLRTMNPRLIYGSISGYGQDGPDAYKGAVDQIIQGRSGLMSLTGTQETGPLRAGIALSDLAAGHQLAFGLLVALYERQQSGEGQWVQVSLLQSMINMLDFQAVKYTVDGAVAQPVGNHHPDHAPMGTFAADDGYINVAASTPRLWQAFLSCMNDERFTHPMFATPLERRRNREALNAIVTDVLSTNTVAHWVEAFEQVGVPCGPVLTVDQVFNDPQVQHLNVTVTVEHPERGATDVLAAPVRMSRTTPATPQAAPTKAQHTRQILTELGFSDEEIHQLGTAGTIGLPATPTGHSH